MTKVLIAGATGLVGKLALDKALADSRVSRVVAVTRRPLASHAKLENPVVDFDHLPAEAAWWAVDGVICALGTTRAVAKSRSVYRTIDYEYPLAVARHARAHGATRFALTSSLGAHTYSPFFYTRTKGELERDLQALAFPSLTIVRPSVLEGPREGHRAGENAAGALFHMLARVLPRWLHVSPADAVAATLLDAALAGRSGVHIKYNADMV